MKVEYIDCPNCSATGTIEIDCTNYSYDHNCAPSYRLEECPDCEGGQIINDN